MPIISSLLERKAFIHHSKLVSAQTLAVLVRSVQDFLNASELTVTAP